MSFYDRDQPAWRHYENDRFALQSILACHQREIGKAQDFIDWASNEVHDITCHLNTPETS